MGRLFACVLFIAACGDNLISDPSQDPSLKATGLDPTSITNGAPAQRLVPAVCSSDSWSVTPTAKAVELAVASSHGVTSVFTIPERGGQLYGFTVDERMVVTSDPKATKLAVADSFTSVSASVLQDRPVTSGVTGDAAYVDLFADGINARPKRLGKVAATTLARSSFLQLVNSTMLVTGGTSGVSLTEIGTNFDLGTTTLVGASKPVTSLSASQYGQTIIATWTTADRECYVEHVAGLVQGNAVHSTTDCDHARIASNITNDDARIVFDGAGGLRVMHLSHMQLGGETEMLRPLAAASRIVFDGLHYWVSYIDTRGQIVVGFLDAQSHLVSMAIDGPAPIGESYELSVIDGRVWVIAQDLTSGYTATQMCLANEVD
jgi:hypothetical protein